MSSSYIIVAKNTILQRSYIVFSTIDVNGEAILKKYFDFFKENLLSTAIVSFRVSDKDIDDYIDKMSDESCIIEINIDGTTIYIVKSTLKDFISSVKATDRKVYPPVTRKTTTKTTTTKKSTKPKTKSSNKQDESNNSVKSIAIKDIDDEISDENETLNKRNIKPSKKQIGIKQESKQESKHINLSKNRSQDREVRKMKVDEEDSEVENSDSEEEDTTSHKIHINNTSKVKSPIRDDSDDSDDSHDSDYSDDDSD